MPTHTFVESTVSDLELECYILLALGSLNVQNVDFCLFVCFFPCWHPSYSSDFWYWYQQVFANVTVQVLSLGGVWSRDKVVLDWCISESGCTVVPVTSLASSCSSPAICAESFPRVASEREQKMTSENVRQLLNISDCYVDRTFHNFGNTPNS